MRVKYHLERVRPSKERRLAALGVEPLRPDEVSVKLRVRLRREALVQVERLSPVQRGEALSIGLRALGLLEVEDAAAHEQTP